MAMQPRGSDGVLSVIRDADVFSFLLEEIGRLRPWDEFRELPMPAELEPGDMWEIVEFLRKVAYGKTFTFSPRGGDPIGSSWYGFTSESQSLINQLGYRSRAGGSLAAGANAYIKRTGYMPAHLSELEAVAYRENLHVDYETIRRLAIGGERPETTDEMVIWNAIKLREQLEARTACELDDSFLSFLMQGLDQGVCDTGYKPKPHRGTAYDEYSRLSHKHIRENILSVQQGETHPIVAVLMNSDIIWNKPLFPRWTNLMELLVREFSFMKMGLPVMRYVPYSKSVLEWEEDRPSGGYGYRFRFGCAILESGFGLDVMPYYEQLLQFMKEGLDLLEQTIDRDSRKRESAKQTVRNDCRLNHRQRQLIECLIDNPNAPVDACSHQHANGIAISTAHVDLKKLVEMGYLTLSVDGKRQMFTIGNKP